MALPAFEATVTMSAADISVEIGNSTTAMLDFQGAAASFSGIASDELTEGFGAEAIEIKEFYGKTFSAGSGTYGTRNAHIIKYLTDAGASQAWSSNQMINAAENSTTGMSANTSFSARTETYHFDDYIDDDLTDGDTAFIGTTGTGKFDGTAAAVDSGGTGVRFYFDDTADDIASINSSGVVANARSITPSNVSCSISTINTTSIVVKATANTQVTRTIRFYKDNGTEQTKTAGTHFDGGGLDDTNVSVECTYDSLASGTEFDFKARGENAVANGADSSTIAVSTATPSTAWSNVPTDFNLHLPDGDSSIDDDIKSQAKQITLANGSGNTTISCQAPTNSLVEFKVAASTSGDPGVNGTGNSGTGFGNSVTIAAGTTYHLRFFLGDARDDTDGGQAAQDRTVTFTNNGVSNTDLQVNIKFIELG